MSELHVGLATLGLPLLLIGLLVFGRWRIVAWLYVVALAVGLGYLSTTGAVEDIGRQALDVIGKKTAAPAATESAPAAPSDPTSPVTTVPESTPAPAPETPAPEAAPAPAPEAPAEPAPAPATTP